MSARFADIISKNNHLLVEDGCCDLALGMVGCCCWLFVQWWLLLVICPSPPGLVPACLLFTSWVSSCLVALDLLVELLPASCPSPPETDLELQESITMAVLVECWCGGENRGVLLVVL
jgi:hypothetical protein